MYFSKYKNIYTTVTPSLVSSFSHLKVSQYNE